MAVDKGIIEVCPEKERLPPLHLVSGPLFNLTLNTSWFDFFFSPHLLFQIPKG